ncbi:phosphomethylpyrimidine synthase ThiC [Pseudothermotoga thermarum]|uniref:Phosphomethylpyrimidine synthase n=1 Tax=Pseudothermotoga thermarum DSM 5069 TaxID=688269 RepID=F7YUG5_9THEM|nr:phosphomethylpyrimidine synthase ThiC [Pseudothermotoga thermarum]AEH51436.1 hydroxymethylpyrimidine synthase [Pseudothermotoga thermarum DSM 5069]
MTQLEAARLGKPTSEMLYVAEQEMVNLETVIEKIAQGKAVIPRNKNHKSLTRPVIIGEGFSVKVNANIGTSIVYSNIDEELRKLQVALHYGTDTVMVLSTGGDIKRCREIILENSPVPVGSVPIYDTAVKSVQLGKKVIDFSEKDFIDLIKEHAETGIDFMTIHAGITMRTLNLIKNSKRIMKIVSRGGSIIAGWMIANEKENPLYTHFDEILEIAKEYDVTLSLGDGLRPGAVLDASDTLQFSELFVLAELAERANEAGVQVMIEGPGHVPLNEIEMNVKLMKKITKGRPIFLLGPLPTDRGVGYDHLVASIGGALAAYYGTDFLCYVTPAEHLCLPDVEDVKEGVIASKIAATIADVAKGNKKALMLEEKMASARANFDWESMFKYAIAGDVARKKWETRRYDEEGCSMCGPFCAIKITKEYVENAERLVDQHNKS